MGKLIQYCTKASKFDGEFAWQAAGMGYLIFTEENSLIVIDGGTCPEDTQNLLRIMEDASHGIPRVKLWILTHPHFDHYAALLELAKSPADRARVEIDTLCYCNPNSFTWIKRGTQYDAKKDLEAVDSIANMLSCRVLRPKSGDRLDIDGTTVEFLYTYENAETLADPNELSLVFTVTGKHKKAMFTGDAYSAGLEVVYKTYKDRPDILRSDIVQIAHHGLNGGHTLFYKLVDADVALVPISRSGDRAMLRPEENCAHHNLYAEARAHSVIKAYCGTAALEF